MVDAAQAALITAGKLPPSPEHIPFMLKQTFVDSNMMKLEDVKAIRDLYLLHKGIIHGDIVNIKGADIDAWQEHAERFLSNMTDIIAKLLENK